jgi:hypothetical protein
MRSIWFAWFCVNGLVLMWREDDVLFVIVSVCICWMWFFEVRSTVPCVYDDVCDWLPISWCFLFSMWMVWRDYFTSSIRWNYVLSKMSTKTAYDCLGFEYGRDELTNKNVLLDLHEQYCLYVEQGWDLICVRDLLNVIV